MIPVDDATMAGFAAGDPAAVRRLYQDFARPLATVARSLVGNDQAMIDDVVQQTFAKAWKAAGTFDVTRGAVAPWLYSIARRTAIDHLRAERRPTRGDHEPETDVAVPPVSLVATWEAYEVRQALEALPAEEREVLGLSHMYGLPHPQIAERLGIPLGTVKSRSHRGLRRLATALAHLEAVDVDVDAVGDGPHDQTPGRRFEQVENQIDSSDVRSGRDR